MTNYICITGERDLLRNVLEPWGDCTFLDGGASVELIEKTINHVDPDCVFVFGCKHILPSSLIEKVPFYNLHSSLLPRCRGPAPHIWSFIEGEGIGVTLHVMDKDLDCGPIVDQLEVQIDYGAHSIFSAFQLLHVQAALLLSVNMPQIASGNVRKIKQSGTETRHTELDHLLILDAVNENLTISLEEFVSIIRPKTKTREYGVC